MAFTKLVRTASCSSFGEDDWKGLVSSALLLLAIPELEATVVAEPKIEEEAEMEGEAEIEEEVEMEGKVEMEGEAETEGEVKVEVEVKMVGEGNVLERMRLYSV